MCIDHRALWAYDYARAEQILNQTKTRIDAQMYFSYWGGTTDDKSYKWTPADGNFDRWLDSMKDPVNARQCWETHAQSSANMVAYNGGQWGPQYANFNSRGQYVTWPGEHASTWNEEFSAVIETWQVPRGIQGVRQFGVGGVDGTGRYACWYTPE